MLKLIFSDMEWLKIVVPFLTGSLGGAFLNNLITNYKNKIQKLQCCYVDDDIISKLPVEFGETKHENLHSKSFEIINSTNMDIPEITINFEFETTAVVTKCVSYSKAGLNIPKGKINNKKNECQFVVTHFNRKDKIEISFEIADITEDKFNVTELKVTGIKIDFKDKRKPKAARPVKMVEKKDLNSLC